MSVEINEKLVDQIASRIKTQDDLADFSRLLIKATVERVMAAELEEHLGYAKYSPEGHNTGNSRNGSTSKNIKGDFGEVEVKVPRDRNGDFAPQLIAKGQTRLNKLDQQIPESVSSQLKIGLESPEPKPFRIKSSDSDFHLLSAFL
tara:strand:- start:1163 stop:1600 length:438 start_codon:yes stop_codon:yes gene_type:complete